MTLRSHLLAAELEKPIADGDTATVLSLIAQWGISEAEKRDVCGHLSRSARNGEEVTLRFDSFDRASLAGVWARHTA